MRKIREKGFGQTASAPFPHEKRHCANQKMGPFSGIPKRVFSTLGSILQVFLLIPLLEAFHIPYIALWTIVIRV